MEKNAYIRMMRAYPWESPSWRKKFERLVIAACVGAIMACAMSWIIFFPVLA